MQEQVWASLVALGLSGILLGSCLTTVDGTEKRTNPVAGESKKPAGKKQGAQQSPRQSTVPARVPKHPMRKKPTEQEETPSSTEHTGPTTSSLLAQRALGRAKKCIKERKLTLATYYLTCAVTHDPSNMEAVREYHNVVTQIARNDYQQNRRSSAIEKLRALSDFLRQHTAHVLPDHIEELLKIADDVEKRIADWSRQTSIQEARPSQTETEERLAELKQIANKGLFQNNRLSEYLAAARSLREEIELYFPSLVPEIERVLRRLEANRHFLSQSAAFETFLRSFSEFCEASSTEKTIKGAQSQLLRAAYTLQHCEALVRDWMALRSRLPSDLQTRVDEAVVQLNEAATKLQEKRSSVAWREFMTTEPTAFSGTVEKLLQSIRRWRAPADAAPDGDCQKQIERIQAVMREAGSISAHLEHPKYKDKLQALIKELTKSMRIAVEAQRNRYSLWALKRIEQCNKRYYEAKGFVDDAEPMIAAALIEELSPINVTALRSEVYRLYNEVFNTAISELSLGGENEEENDTKVYVLKQLTDLRVTKKVYSPSDF